MDTPAPKWKATPSRRSGRPSSPPPSKYRRVADEPVIVKLSSVPQGYDHEKLLDLLEHVGADPDGLQSTRFLGAAGGSDAITRTAMLTFDGMVSATSACDGLNGQEVATFSGDVKCLVAQIHRNDQSSTRGKAAGKGPKGGNDLLPSVYISDLPVEYTDETVRDMCQQEGIDADLIVSVKFLPSKGQYNETGACILRFKDEDSANAAILALKGKDVLTTSGATKYLGARMAKPAAWMTGNSDRSEQVANHRDDHQEDERSASGRWNKRKRQDEGSRSTRDLSGTQVLKLSSVPEGYDHDKLLELLSHVELDPDSVVASRFLPPRGYDTSTRTALLTFDSMASASAAHAVLNGQEVATFSGDIKCLVAQLSVDQLEDQGPGKGGGKVAKGRGKDTGKGQKDAPIVKEFCPGQGNVKILPSVYYSDLPLEYKDASVRELHETLGLDVGQLVSIKFLPSKNAYDDTGACIIRYQNDDAANQAIAALRGTEVYTSSGARKWLGAKLAKPAKWMTE